MKKLINYLKVPIQAAPLAVFRICFGLLMFISIVRFWSKGWIEKLYIEPSFHFSYLGFEWVKPLGAATYLIFAVCAISALFVVIGWKYRTAMLLFFLSFSYIELMDKTTYLNHYYFVSSMSFLLLFLPLGKHYSLDSKGTVGYTPRYTVFAIQLLLTIVYFYAGLAKLNSDWLVEAMPLKIWLSTKTDIPLFGQLLEKNWVHYAFSFFGAFYDLTIAFFLWNKKSRPIAFIAVVIFHLLTSLLFPIGMFPYIMIVSTLIFFSPSFHEKILQKLNKLLARPAIQFVFTVSKIPRISSLMISLFFIAQFLIPWRYLAYPGELFWTEEGFRFSWRVMLMEKSGYAQFSVVDSENKEKFAINNADFLTPFQEKQMSFQPDFILEYAHFLHDHFEKEGITDPEIYVESYVALNGRLSQRFIKPDVNLAKIDRSLKPKTFIEPFDQTIYGL